LLFIYLLLSELMIEILGSSKEKYVWFGRCAG